MLHVYIIYYNERWQRSNKFSSKSFNLALSINPDLTIYMKLKTYLLLVFITTIQCLYSQNEGVLEDYITLPQDQFNALYDAEKVTNPLHLNGNVNTVMRTFTQHKSPYSEKEYTDHYSYTLDKNHTVTDYRSDLEYDDMTVENFAVNTTFKIEKIDTVISSNTTKYTYKKGLLMVKETQNFDDGVMDSVTFKYKKGKLTEKIHYTSMGAFEVDDEGDVDESYMLFSEFEVASYTKITYTKLGLMATYSHYAPNPDIVEVQENRYTYNNEGQLENYTLVYNRYYAETIDVYSKPETWKFETDGLIDIFFEEVKGSYAYDVKGRIIKHQLEKNNKESESYIVDYTNNGFTIKMVTDYYKEYDYETLLHQDLEYEYSYDALKNPVDIKSYIIDAEGKYLDKSTTLKINYFDD